MNVPDIIIAVDGFSATGKSTFAKMVAKEFGFLYLDSGAMYRGVTLFSMENGMIAEGPSSRTSTCTSATMTERLACISANVASKRKSAPLPCPRT